MPTTAQQETPDPNEPVFLSRRDYCRTLQATYARNNRSSRTTPQSAPVPPVGSWMMDDGPPTLDGHDILELINVDVDNIEISEATGQQKHPDVRRYADWLKKGLEAPPINILQSDTGRLKTLDHRRLLAAKLVGRPTIKAWVSWTTTSDRNEMTTGLTRELAQKGKKRLPIKRARPEHTSHPDDRAVLTHPQAAPVADDPTDRGAQNSRA